MKKLLLLFGVAILCTGCPGLLHLEHLGDTRWTWFVENNTDETLIFKYPASPQVIYNGDTAEIKYLEVELVSGALRILHYETLKYTDRDVEEVPFDTYFATSVSRFGEDVSWQILSEDGDAVLKEWKYLDRNFPDQRFFDQSEWEFYKGHHSEANGGTDMYNRCFYISPEDVVSE